MALTHRVGLASLLSVLAFACTGEVDDPGIVNPPPGGGNGSGTTGGASAVGGSTSTGSTASTAGGSGQTGGASNSGGNATTGGAPSLANGGPRLRMLTRAEYTNSITYLVGAISAPLELPPDGEEKGGLTAVEAGKGTINSSSVALYETATRTAVAEVFADSARWQQLVGCTPKVDLSDACVTTFIKTFGKRAFRRDLDDMEVQQWLKVGKDAAQLGNSASTGLSTLTSGILQSPFFLYRIETNQLDATSQRLKYDGRSMATRLSYLLTGAPPSDALLTAAASGQLDTADGVKAAAATLLTDAKAAERMAVFFNEFSQASLVQVTQKSPTLFPMFTQALRDSMEQSLRLWVKDVVIAPGTDVRRFFDSDTFYVDANLAPIYGVSAPASGFMQVKLGPESGRAGVLGQAAVLAGHSQVENTSPTRRGIYVYEHFLCQPEPVLPADIVIPDLSDDPTLTAREKLAIHAVGACAGCHTAFDPLGLGLERLDAIGRYRTMEVGKVIDATGTLDGVPYDGAAEMGAVFANNQRVLTCLMNNFYSHANGVEDYEPDSAQIASLTQVLATKGYVWRDFVADFVASEAFRSAPAAVTAGNP
jgi:hypothetical protein